MKFHIGSAESLNVSDFEISGILTSVYVDGGFTVPEKAAALFSPSAVRGRGRLICARPEKIDALAGMVILVFPDSPARRIAAPNEVEIHLLAVGKNYRGFGLGSALVAATVEAAHAQNFRKMVLWTQPEMSIAQKLYESLGFVRAAHRDPAVDGKHFLVYEKRW